MQSLQLCININYGVFFSLAKDAKLKTLVVCLLYPMSRFVIFLIHFLYPFRSVWLRIIKFVITVCIIKITRPFSGGRNQLIAPHEI